MSIHSRRVAPLEMDRDDEEEVEVAGDFDDFELPPTPEATDDESEQEDEPDSEAEEADAASDTALQEQASPLPRLSPEDSLVVPPKEPIGPGEIRVLPPEECITSAFLDCNEVARILAVRAEQIARRNDVFLPKGATRCSHNPVLLAKQELRAGMCPLIVQRRRAPRVIEEHRVRDLVLLDPI